MRLYVEDIPKEYEVNQFMKKIGMFDKDNSYTGKFDWHEWSLSEIGFPSSAEILNSVKKIESEIGVEAWVKKNYESPAYKGFSLTYNKDFDNKDRSIYHQTLGDDRVIDNYSRLNTNSNEIRSKQHSYYDSLAFRNIHPLIKNEFGDIFSKINGAIVRSRVAYLESMNIDYSNPKGGWHIDEHSQHMIRLIIPIKTTDNFFIKIEGEDEDGNTCFAKNYPIEDKLYIWNQRIPHTIGADKPIAEHDPRIYFIIGISPWLSYNEEEDYFETNDNWKIPIGEIVQNKLWLKK